jgi:hypothetical protein
MENDGFILRKLPWSIDPREKLAIIAPLSHAGVVKLVYTRDSKSLAERRGGSSPPTGTILKTQLIELGFFMSKIWLYPTTEEETAAALTAPEEVASYR